MNHERRRDAYEIGQFVFKDNPGLIKITFGYFILSLELEPWRIPIIWNALVEMRILIVYMRDPVRGCVDNPRACHVIGMYNESAHFHSNRESRSRRESRLWLARLFCNVRHEREHVYLVCIFRALTGSMSRLQKHIYIYG